MNATKFPKPHPTEAEFWNLRFDAGFTPWDQGGVPASLQSWATRASGNPAPRVLIPGCGSAYEVRFLAGLGWQGSAIDFSPAAVAQAKRVLGPLARHVHLAHFFADDLGGAPLCPIFERRLLLPPPRPLLPAWAV